MDSCGKNFKGKRFADNGIISEEMAVVLKERIKKLKLIYLQTIKRRTSDKTGVNKTWRGLVEKL